MFAGSGDEDIRVGLFAEDGMTPVFRAVADSAAVFTGSLERSMSGLARIGPAAAPLLGIAGVFIAAGSAAAGVQQNVANLNAALNATPAQLKQIRDAGLQLAQQTQFTDAQIIDSQRQLAKAHADTLAIIKETRDVTNLAGATQSTPVAAATLLTTAQKTFGLGSNDSAKQSDILATAIDSSVGNANDMAVALKQVGPTARAAGIDLQTFTTAVADLQNQGLRGSAGTAMQTFLQRIMRETPQAKAAIKELGLEFYNSDQTLKPYADILDEIRIKTAGVSEETRNADLTAIFGQRGIKIADIASESGSSGFADTQQHEESLGTAAEMNAKKLDTFSGSASRLGSSINTVGVQLGTVLLPEMKAAGDLGISVANVFSTLNGHVALLPQLLVGAGALFGLSKVNNLLDMRKQSNAQPGIDAASKQAAVDQANAEARAKAEFTADSQIFAARQELDAKIIALDNAAYDNWIKIEMDGAKTYEAATAKQLASLQSITEKTLADIAKVDAAQTAAAQATIDRAELNATRQQAINKVDLAASTKKDALGVEKQGAFQSIDQEAAIRKQEADAQRQRALLAARQQEEDNQAALASSMKGQSPEYKQQQSRALEARSLDERISIQQTYNEQSRQIDADAASQKLGVQQQYAAESAGIDEKTYARKRGIQEEYVSESIGIDERLYSVQRDNIVSAAEQHIQQVEREYQARLAAIKEGVDAGLIAEEEGYAKSIAAAKAAAAEREAIARAGGANALGTGMGPGGSAAAGADTYEGTIGNGPVPIPVKGQVVAKEVEAEAGLKAKVGGALSTFGAAAGEFVMPVLVAVSAKEFVLDPILAAWGKKKAAGTAIDKDASSTALDLKASVTLGVDPAQVREQAQLAIKQFQDEIDAEQKAKDASHKPSGPIGLTPVGYLIEKSGVANAGSDAYYDKQIQDLKDSQQQARDIFANQDPIKKNADAVNYLTTAYGDLEAKVSTGTISLDTATARGQVLAMQQIQLGVSTDKVGETYRAFTKTLEDNIKAQQDASQQAELTLSDNIAASQKNKALGLGDDLNAVASFGIHLSGQDATKAEIAAAKKDASDLEKAWTQAGTAINQVDISKGFDAFAANAPALDKAVSDLQQLGQKDDALTALDNLADSFKKITDAEQVAEQAFDGYMLSISNGDSAISKLDQIKKGFLEAVNAAEVRQDKGIASADDNALVASKSNVINNINGQEDNIRQQSTGDWLGLAQNLPAFDKMNQDVKDVLTQAGGGKQVVITAEAETAKAKQDITDIVNGPYDAKVNVSWVVDQQLQAFIEQQVEAYARTLPQTPNEVDSAPYQPRDAAGNKIPVPDQPWAGGGGGGGQAANPAGWNQYQPLGQSQYQAIVKQGAGGQPSPLDDKYASVIAAAQKYNIDPRYLLTLTQMESNNGTNPDAYTQGNNYAGIKYGHQPGATPGGISPEGDAYANFDSASSFFDAEAANQRTGDYAGYYNSGDLYGARQHYVAGNATPSDDQKRNIQNTGTTYANYAEQYPSSDAGTGYGAAVDTSIFNQKLPSGDAASNGAGEKMVAAAKSHLGQARDAVGKAWDGWCEQFVGDVEQQAGLAPYRAANPEQHLLDAKNHVAGAGTIVPNGQQRPGDQAIIVAENNPTINGAPYDPSSIGHTGVVAEDTSKFYDTGKGGIHLDTLPTGTVFIRPDGVVSNGPVPGSKAVSGANTQNATAPSGFSSAPITRDFSASSQSMTDVFSNMTGKGVQEALDGVNTLTTAIDKMNKARYTPETTQDEKDRDAAATMQQGAAFGAVWAKTINSIANNVADISTIFPQIEATAGPLASSFEKQALAMQDVQRASSAVAKDTADIAALDQQHQQTVKSRAAADLADQQTQTRQGWADQQAQVEITANRRAITEKEQDDDTARARRQTLDQRSIDDTRLAQQRAWQDEQTDYTNLVQAMQRGAQVQDDADTNHKQALDDAYTQTQRQEQDQQRYLDFIGSETKKNLQDQQRIADDQHRLSTEGMGVSQRLYTNLGAGSQTEGQALAYASQAAAINDARKQSDLLYQQQKDANQREQDQEDKNHALIMYNLQTEQIAAQRKHDDEIKAIDEAATARHQTLSDELYTMQINEQATQLAHQAIQRQEQDADTIRSRTIEDQAFNLAAVRLTEQRQWQDEDLKRAADKTARDIAYQERKWQTDAIRLTEDETYTTEGNTLKARKDADTTALTQAQDNLTAVQKIAGYWGDVYQYAGGTADVLLHGSPGAPAHAGGGLSSQGINRVNEQGGELISLPGGATIIPADQTRRMMDAILNSNVTPISTAPSAQQGGDVNISIAGGDVNLSPAAKARIRALIQDEIAASRGQGVREASASKGALRRA